jgi:hypothetical protein
MFRTDEFQRAVSIADRPSQAFEILFCKSDFGGRFWVESCQPLTGEQADAETVSEP